MTFVTDPDDLDRFQVLFNPDPVSLKRMSIRGQGAVRTAKRTDGDVVDADTFDAAGATFQADSVAVGDILTVASGTNIGHYTVAVVNSETSLDINETFPDTGEGAGTTFRINQVPTLGGASPAVADGVGWQALYTFAKEEWRTLSDADMPDLVKHNFPFVSLTREQYEVGDGAPVRLVAWDFTDDFTRNLLRTGGWSVIDASGFVRQIYSGVFSLPQTGGLDTDTQVYFQQHDADTDPVDFVLTGAVNQSVQVFDEVAGPDTGTGFAVTSSNDLARNDGGDWSNDGFEVGGLATIINSENAGENDGTFRVLTIGSGVDGSLVLESEDGTDQTPLTNNAADTTMRVSVDKRKKLDLRARKKAKSYVASTLAAIGVTVLENIVNRFPLAHIADVAITFDDGEMAGDGTNNVFGGSETHTTDTDGATATIDANGVVVFTSAGATFNSVKTGGGIVLQPGDNLEITSGSDIANYEIKVVGTTTLDLFVDPADVAGFTGGEGSLSFTARTKTRDAGDTGATITLSDQTGGTGRIVDTNATFSTDDALGDRTVAVGDFVVIVNSAEPLQTVGIYKVNGGITANNVEFDISDADWSAITGSDAANEYRIIRPFMSLQFKNEVGAGVTPSVAFDPADATFAGSPPTIVRTAGNWTTDGFIAGGTALVTLAADPANNGTFAIVSIDTDSTADDTLILAVENGTGGTAPLVLDAGPDAINAVPRQGFIRSLNAIPFSFNWRLFGNGGTLGETFQFVQRALRRGRQGATAAQADIDLATAVRRGDVQSLLMSFATPTAVTFNMFIDDLASADFNNVTKQDVISIARNFAFTAGVTITSNANITADQNAKVVVFFTDADATPANGDEFGTIGAIIVENGDGTGSPTVMRAVTGGGGDNATLVTTLNFTFDYDNNAQGGRTPATNADITIVAVGEDQAQYTQATGTILRQNNNTFTLVAPLERTFQNP